MRPKITYKLVPYGTEEFQKLQLFAKSFDHEIVAHPQINVYAFYRNDICFGYSDHVFIPTMYPAFHPALTKASDVIQVLSDWRAHLQFSGNSGYVGVPTPECSGRANFPQSIMEKLGLKRIERELYIPA
jgi:hypothetical protein